MDPAAPMTEEDALRILALQPGCSMAELEQAHDRRLHEVEERIRRATDPAKREQYQRANDIIETAYQTLRAQQQDDGLSITRIAQWPAPARATPPPPRVERVPDPEPAAPRLPAGLLLAGRYQVRQAVKLAPDLDIYQAFDRKQQREVLLQFLPRAMATDSGQRAATAHALDALRHFHHPGFCSLLGLQRDQEQVFLVMQAPAGQPASRWLERRAPLPDTTLRQWLEQLCELCAAIASQRLCVHLTPDNLWLDEAGGAQLLDLGFGGMQPLASRARHAAAHAWLAPEAGEETWQDAAFQYAIAALGYELLTGEAPSAGSPPVEHLAPDAPPAIAAALNRALASSPAARHADLAAMHAALSAPPGRKSVLRAPAALPAAGQAASRRRPWLLAGGGLAVAAALVAALLLGPLGGALFESEAERLARDTAARLHTEAQQALAALPAEAGRLDGAARDLQAELARAEAQLPSASGDARTSLERQITGMRERQATAAEAARRYRELLDDSQGLPQLKEQLRGAEQALAAKQLDPAQSQLNQLLAQARELRESASALTGFMAARGTHQAARKQLDELAAAETATAPPLGALHERLVLDAELAGGKRDYAGGTRLYGQAADLIRDETRKFRQARLTAHLNAARRAAANQDFAAAETALGRAQTVEPQAPEVQQARQELASLKEQTENARTEAERRRREAQQLAEQQKKEQAAARAQAQATAEARARAEAEAAKKAQAEREDRLRHEQQQAAERRQAGMQMCDKQQSGCMEGCNAQVAVEVFSAFLGSRGGGLPSGGSSSCMNNCQYNYSTCTRNLR